MPWRRSDLVKIGQFAAFLLIAVIASARAQVNEQLLGTWRLVSFTARVAETGEIVDTFGKAPYGYLNYSPDGRMLVLMVREDRPKVGDLAQMTDAERLTLFKSMVAYGGTFELDGDRIIHYVDISWNENWTGTTQVRRFRIEGTRLILTQDPQVGPDGRRTTAVLTWERVQ
jgi:Lipocalin-like domain